MQVTQKALFEMWEHPDERVSGKPTIGARKALDKATEMLSQSRMSADSMMTKTFAERYGKIKDILNVSSSGLYDTISGCLKFSRGQMAS